MAFSRLFLSSNHIKFAGTKLLETKFPRDTKLHCIWRFPFLSEYPLINWRWRQDWKEWLKTTPFISFYITKYGTVALWTSRHTTSNWFYAITQLIECAAPYLSHKSMCTQRKANLPSAALRYFSYSHFI